MSNRSTTETLVVVPFGRWFVYALSGILAAVVLGAWTFSFPTDKVTMVLYFVGSCTTIYLIPTLLSSKRVKTQIARREQLHMVIPGLWQGGLGRDAFSFEDYDLDVVVDLRDDRECPGENVLVPLGKRYIRWPMVDRDLPDLLELDSLAKFLADKIATRRVGVFCNLGVNRSGLVCAAVARIVAEQGIVSLVTMEKHLFNDEFIKHVRAERSKLPLLQKSVKSMLASGPKTPQGKSAT